MKRILLILIGLSIAIYGACFLVWGTIFPSPGDAFYDYYPPGTPEASLMGAMCLVYAGVAYLLGRHGDSLGL